MNEKKLDWYVQQVQNLPTLPVVAMRLEEAISNPRSSAADVSNIIKQDPALTARLLKIANSSYYGFPQTIGTVNLAVVVIGFDALMSLCRIITVSNHINRWSSFSEKRIQDFWQHSLTCAEIAHYLGAQLRVRASGELYTAGILHDVGILAFSHLKRDEYNKIDDFVIKNQKNRTDVEQRTFGIGHATLGGLLLRHWHLPDRIAEAVEGHHASLDEEVGEDARIIRLADKLSYMINKVEKEIDGEVTAYFQSLFSPAIEAPEIKEKIEQMEVRIKPALENAEELLSVLRGRG